MIGDVLILGSAQYSDPSWVNCQQIASRLAANHRVLFVDSVGLRRMRPTGTDLRRMLRRLRDAGRGVMRYPDGVMVVSPIAQTGPVLVASIRSALRKTGIAPSALIVYLPTWTPVAERFPRARRIYHCVDAFAENPGVDRTRIEGLERRLLRSVDLVLAVSEPLRSRLATLHPDVRLVPNVADVDRFAAGGAVPDDMETIPHPRLLYLGNLAVYKVDIPLLAEVARSRSDWSFVLIGPAGRGDPETDLAELRSLRNVHLLGERERRIAPAYVAAADVCLLPLRTGKSTASSCPMKTYEYLAGGKPVVATPIPALEGLIRAGLVYGAHDRDGWTAAVAAALTDKPAAQAARREEASKHGWARRMVEIEELISRG